MYSIYIFKILYSKIGQGFMRFMSWDRTCENLLCQLVKMKAFEKDKKSSWIFKPWLKTFIISLNCNRIGLFNAVKYSVVTGNQWLILLTQIWNFQNLVKYTSRNYKDSKSVRIFT
jgi:hypothetical protein